MKTFNFREIPRGRDFDPLAVHPDAPFTQAAFYGDWQRALGRTVKRFIAESNGETVACFQSIRYPLPFGKNCLYIPYGPVVKDFSEEFLIALKNELFRIARAENAVFTRLDFTPAPNDEQKKLLERVFARAPLRTYRSAYFQPRLEWHLSLDKPEELLLSEMHEKARYSIGLAKRKGVVTEIISSRFEEYLDPFCRLLSETAHRGGFSLHPREYYENIFRNLGGENSYLSISRYGGKILVVNLIVLYGNVATYLFGASSGERRNLMPTYFAHWEAICRAKELGCLRYNFGGISAEGNIPGWEGITAFKKKFGGIEVKHSDFFDAVSQPFWYRLYTIGKLLGSGGSSTPSPGPRDLSPGIYPLLTFYAL
jgi:lipid II:glycine glycyltransferase (peptidoglycan interpeptide bridge formation enzyme)